MFAWGLAAGAAEEVSAGQERIRERIERQLQEARSYADVARKRDQEAQAVRTQISNANKSYGVSENTLFSAYRNGHFDDYLKLIEKARAAGGADIDPQVLESFYEIPSSVRDADTDIDEEIRSAFGVINRNLDNARSPEDVGFGTIFFDALGVDTVGASRRGLRGETVDGYSVEDLMNLPSLSPIQGDGGKINPSLYEAADPESPKEAKSLFTGAQIVDLAGDDFANRAITLFGGRLSGPDQREALTASIKVDLARYLQENNIKTIPSEEQMAAIVDNVYRTSGGRVFVNTMVEDPENPGTTMWTEINDDGTRSGSFPESEVAAQVAPAGDRPTDGSEPTTGSGFPSTVNHPTHGPLPFAFVGEDGRPRYFLPSGQVVPYNGVRR